MAVIQGNFVHTIPAADQLEQRAIVSDRIRHLSNKASRILFLVSKGPVDQKGYAWGKGFIGKYESKNLKVEQYYSLPKENSKTVTAASGLTLTFSDVTDMVVGQMFINTANRTRGIVASIAASPTNTATFVTVGGVTFSASPNDILIRGQILVKEGSNLPDYYLKGDDLVTNIISKSRNGFGITDFKAAAAHLAGGAYLPRKQQEEFENAIRENENALVWSESAASGWKTTVGANEIPSSKGLWEFAKTSYDMNGSPNLEKMLYDIPIYLHKSIQGANLVWLCSTLFYNTVNKMLYEKGVINDMKGTVEKFGVQIRSLDLGIPGSVTFVPHYSFDAGDFQTLGLIFDPEYLQYCYLSGNDYDIVPDGLQDNDSETKVGEIKYTNCLLPLCGGYKIMQVVNAL